VNELVATHEPNLAPRRRRAAPARASAAEIREVVERAARVADGLVLLERAPLECVAVLLGIEPAAVERVRTALEDPAVREEAVRHARAAAAARATAAPLAPAPRPLRGVEELLAAARARTDGLPLLLTAAPEAAAVAFGVHPELVHRAREAAGAGELPPAG
jgi:hypothetical protein